MAQNEKNQPTDSVERVDIHQNIGARRREDGGPDTSFDMETGTSDDEQGMETGAATGGVVSGAIHNPATDGGFGSGPVNIGPGTSGGTRSMDTSGNADVMGQTTAGAGDWSRAGGSGAGTMSDQGRVDATDTDAPVPPVNGRDGESDTVSQGTRQRDEDRRHGVGNRATYMSEEPQE